MEDTVQSPLAAVAAQTPQLQPGQSAMEWLQDTAKERTQQAQTRRGALQPQMTEANAQAAAQVGQPRIDPALAEEFARSQYLANMGGAGGFGAELARGNGAYQKAKFDEAEANAKRQDDLRQQRLTQLAAQERIAAGDETTSMNDMTRIATARAATAAAGAARYKNVGGILYDTQTLDAEGRPKAVTANNPVGKLYQQLRAEVARRALSDTAPAFQSDGEREQWINDQAAAAFGRLNAAVGANSFENAPPGTPAASAGTPTRPAPQPAAAPATPPAAQATPLPGKVATPPSDGSAAPGASKFAGFALPVAVTPPAVPRGALRDPNAEKVATKGKGASAELMAKYYVDDVVKGADAAREILQATKQLASMELPSGAIKTWTIEKLGPMADAMRQAGMGDTGPILRQSIAMNSAQPIIEKMRQSILQLAKGVQTEGDADRALAQIANMKSPKEAFQAMLKLQAALAQRGIDRQGLFDEYGSANNGLYTGAPQRWQAYSAATPLFAKNSRGELKYEPDYIDAYVKKFPKEGRAAAVAAWREEAGRGK